jgi:predicted nuclease with TOPRIM domain
MPYLIIILITAISSAGFFGYTHYTNILEDLDAAKQNIMVAEANNTILEASLEQQQQVIEKQQREFAIIQKANEELVVARKNIAKEYKDLNKKFTESKNGQERDIGKLALKKSGLIERVINKATVNANRCVEISMGSPLTEDELNATKKSQINGECPIIANPNYRKY